MKLIIARIPTSVTSHTAPRRMDPVRRIASPASPARRAASPRSSPARPVGSSPERASPVARPKPLDPSLKVGIVLMTRKPHRFDYWLRYHRALGICHVFVHVEDTPDLPALLQTVEYADFVTVTVGSDKSANSKGRAMSNPRRQTRRSHPCVIPPPLSAGQTTTR